MLKSLLAGHKDMISLAKWHNKQLYINGHLLIENIKNYQELNFLASKSELQSNIYRNKKCCSKKMHN